MNTILKKHLPRRTFLRGAGISLALPLLDSMIPALTAQTKTAANPIQRLGFVYVPHGMIMDQFTPAGEGSAFELTPILRPLAPFRDHLTVVSGLEHRSADYGGVHSLSPPTWLSGVRPASKEGDIRAGTTIDQIAASHIGQGAQFPSLELATEDHSGLIGACDGGYSCTYINTISWRTPTEPLPMEINPRIVFERLFGDGGSLAQREGRMRQNRSILDAVARQAKRLGAELPSADRITMTNYLDNVREIERRIQVAEKQTDLQTDIPAAPAGIPDSFEDHIKLMFELQVVAFQADLTRVSTYMLARELSQRTYPQVDCNDPHHSLSHHQNDPVKIAALARLQTYHMQMFAHYLDRLRSTSDGDGTLLDHTMILYGSNMSNSNLHNHFPLPVLLAGGAGGRLAGNRHLKYADRTPMANLLMSMLAKFHLPVEHLGDSTGALVDL
ncbi:MAG: DUF1552 domain-containing protein [Bryobacterales bacterium]|nr:DUF1552 domain-containing protein [Bryobacterales bacterium]